MKRISSFVVLSICILTAGCSRAALRFYGTSGEFGPVITGVKAESPIAEKISILQPVDNRIPYLGQSVAGTSWKGTRTDTFTSYELIQVVRKELTGALQASGLFTTVIPYEDTTGLQLETEIRAFGAQVRGFIITKNGGVCAFKFTLRKGREVVFEKTYEKVVTDWDKEYTGSRVGFIEQGMRDVMKDSLRELLEDFFHDLESLKISE